MVSRVCTVLMVATFSLSGNAYAVDDRERSASIYNKVKLLDWLVHDSPTSKRIEESPDEEARAQLKRAQDMWEQAVEHSERSEFELAEGHINAGLKLMTKVSRKVKDEDKVKQARIELYRQVKDHVDMFVVAFDRIEKEKGGEHVSNLLDRDQLDTVITKAESKYAEGDLAMANHLIGQAADMVDNALSDARHKDVLLHELSFESLEEEYAYEIDRNESYVKLIDLMQKKTTPSDASASYVRKLVAQNAQLREQADALAKKGELEKSISVLEKGTDKLSRALRMSGASF